MCQAYVVLSILILSVNGQFTIAAEPVKEIKRFEGTWKMVSEEVEGQKTPKEQLQPDLEIIIRDDYALLRYPGKEPHATMRSELIGKRSVVDIVYIEEFAPGVKGRWSVGIYEWVDEDTFRVCRTVKPGVARPDKFETSKDSGRSIITWRRIK